MARLTWNIYDKELTAWGGDKSIKIAGAPSGGFTWSVQAGGMCPASPGAKLDMPKAKTGFSETLEAAMTDAKRAAEGGGGSVSAAVARRRQRNRK